MIFNNKDKQSFSSVAYNFLPPADYPLVPDFVTAYLYVPQQKLNIHSFHAFVHT